LLTKATGRSAKDAEGTVDTVMDVASGAVKGFSTVFMSLEEGAKIVADSARKNTVTVVTHRFVQSDIILKDQIKMLLLLLTGYEYSHHHSWTLMYLKMNKYVANYGEVSVPMLESGLTLLHNFGVYKLNQNQGFSFVNG
jgi:hypothetical protein